MVIRVSDKKKNYSKVTKLLVKPIINYDLESLNYTVSKMSDDQYIIVQKDAAVSEVVELVEPTIADSILEYNHYVLKTNY